MPRAIPSARSRAKFVHVPSVNSESEEQDRASEAALLLNAIARYLRDWQEILVQGSLPAGVEATTLRARSAELEAHAGRAQLGAFESQLKHLIGLLDRGASAVAIGAWLKTLSGLVEDERQARGLPEEDLADVPSTTEAAVPATPADVPPKRPAFVNFPSERAASAGAPALAELVSLPNDPPLPPAKGEPLLSPSPEEPLRTQTWPALSAPFRRMQELLQPSREREPGPDRTRVMPPVAAEQQRGRGVVERDSQKAVPHHDVRHKEAPAGTVVIERGAAPRSATAPRSRHALERTVVLEPARRATQAASSPPAARESVALSAEPPAHFQSPAPRGEQPPGASRREWLLVLVVLVAIFFVCLSVLIIVAMRA